MSNTITSANSVYMIAVPPLFPVPQQLQGFAADAAFDTETVELAEIMMGVDGVMASGWLPRMTKQTISLMASSPSIPFFEAWVLAQDAIKETYPCTATITLSSVNRKYALSNGILSSVTAMPSAKKVLEPRTFVITWNYITPAAL